MRAAAIRRMATAPPGEVAGLSSEAGFALAAPLFAGEHLADAVDTAKAVLGRERALHLRILFQAGIGALLTICFATAASPITHLMAVVAALAAAPSWVLAVGAPDGLAAAILAVPVFGLPARELLHARLLAALALFLGLGAEPALARLIAERLVGAPLPDAAIFHALSPGGTFAGTLDLRAESEAALLRASSRLERSAFVRVRMTYLAIAALTLAAVFFPAWQRAAALKGNRPVPTRIPRDDAEERPGILFVGTDGRPL